MRKRISKNESINELLDQHDETRENNNDRAEEMGPSWLPRKIPRRKESRSLLAHLCT